MPSSRPTATAMDANASFDFEHVDVVDAQTGSLQGFVRRRHHAHAHVRGIDAGNRVGHQSPGDRQAAFLGSAATSYQREGSAIIDATGVASGDRAILLENRRKPSKRFGGGCGTDVLVGRERQRLTAPLRDLVPARSARRSAFLGVRACSQLGGCATSTRRLRRGSRRISRPRSRRSCPCGSR